jgi:RHS repeat-associated protein
VVQDRLHSVRGLVRRDGTWIRSLRYLSYGGLESDTASAAAPSWALRYRWTGRELDTETGLYFFRARYYDPGVRRFVQEDPIGYGGGGNLYAYGPDPFGGRDPDGTEMDPDEMTCHNCRSLHSRLDDPPGDIFDWDWGGGSGDWMQLVDLQQLYDDIAAGGYASYGKNAQAFLSGNLVNAGSHGPQVRIMSESEYNKVVNALSDFLSFMGQPGWGSYQTGLLNALSGGWYVYVALHDPAHFGAYTARFGACVPNRCVGADTFRPGWPSGAVTILRPDFFDLFDEGHIANAMVHEWTHVTQGPDECTAYAQGEYWTGVHVPVPRGVACASH